MSAVDRCNMLAESDFIAARWTPGGRLLVYYGPITKNNQYRRISCVFCNTVVQETYDRRFHMPNLFSTLALEQHALY